MLTMGPGIFGHLAQALWSGMSPTWKSTTLARYGHVTYSASAGTGTISDRAWAAGPAHSAGLARLQLDYSQPLDSLWAFLTVGSRKPRYIRKLPPHSLPFSSLHPSRSSFSFRAFSHLEAHGWGCSTVHGQMSVFTRGWGLVPAAVSHPRTRPGAHPPQFFKIWSFFEKNSLLDSWKT